MAAVSESLQQALKYHEAGELEQAEALYQEIIRVDPGHADALHLLGVAAHQKADHRRVAELIGRAIARQSQSALYHSNLGACYRAMNRIPDAIVAFREAIRLEPRFIGARYNLAMALEASGLKDEALAEYREVLRTNPDYVGALNNMGSLLVVARPMRGRSRLLSQGDCPESKLRRVPLQPGQHAGTLRTL